MEAIVRTLRNPAVADESRADFARLRQWQARGDFDSVVAAALNIWRNQGWVVLGYATFAEAYAGEVGAPLQMSPKNRRRLVAELSAAGMSSRAISAITGQSYVQATADIQTVKFLNSLDMDTAGDPDCLELQTPDRPTVVGLDGAARVCDPTASAKLTADIVALRESNERLTWEKIGAAVGLSKNAASARYYEHQRRTDAEPVQPVEPARKPSSRAATVEAIRTRAAEGASSDLIAQELCLSAEYVRRRAHEEGIELLADNQRGYKVPRGVDTNASTERWVTNLEAAIASSESFLDPEHADPEDAARWASRLRHIASHLQALTRKYDKQTKKERPTA